MKSFAILVILALLFFVSAIHASSEKKADGEVVDASDCPLYEKCPYVKEHASEYKKGEGCPLQKGGCPYYDHHKGDDNLLDVVTEKTHKCPLSGKCKFFDDMKDGKKVDLSGHNCPLAEKCPYYNKVKDGDDSPIKCPLEKACPHFKKAGAHHAHHGDSHDARDCPYLKKQKEEAVAAHAHDEL